LGKPVEPDLSEARKHGWLLSNQENNYQQGENYVFPSSKVRVLAYSMIIKSQRDTFHLMIGRKLWREFHNSEMTSMLPPKYQALVLKHMLLGSRVVTNVEERTAIISLCLAVVKEHIMWSSFSTAAALLKKGRHHLLDNRSWRNDYDVTLALHTVSAEVNYILGDFGVVDKQCSAIFQHARLVDHTIPACSVKISILSAAGNTDEALSMGLDVLKKIGVHVIGRPSKFQTTRTFITLRRLLRKICPATIRQLPLMSDPQKAAAMQIINHMLMPAHFGRESLFLILVSKLIHVTVQHGLCNVSSVAFGWYSLLLVIMGESALASQYGDLAIELLNRFGSKQWLPRVYLSVFGGLYAWTQSITKIIAPLSQAFEVGIQTGDIEVSNSFL
jgi:predicted ATPase